MLKKSSNVGPLGLAIEEEAKFLMSSKLIPVPDSIRHNFFVVSLSTIRSKITKNGRNFPEFVEGNILSYFSMDDCDSSIAIGNCSCPGTKLWNLLINSV